MTPSDDLTARIDVLRGRSRQIASDFSAEMARLTREVAQRGPLVEIEADARGLVSSVAVDPSGYMNAAATALAAATDSALALAGISAMPDVSAKAHQVMQLLQGGLPAEDAIDAVVAEPHGESERHVFPELTVEVDALGQFSVTIDAAWRASATAVEFADAVKTTVNTVITRRAGVDDGGDDE
ncbi:hypothetical protein [Microbacterium sp.]|uniref:hypothetical protein n=1 Tax=Microbacterium sp. TaxID=51671 RepID=UPI003566164A